MECFQLFQHFSILKLTVTNMGGQHDVQQDLINRCKTGDIKAQYSLYKCYVTSLYNVVMRIMNNKMDADEIVQDTFITAFNKINDYKGQGAFAGWLKRIAINNSIAVLRKRKIHFEDIEQVNVASEIPDEIEESMNPEFVHEAIKSLPEKARVVLNLYAMEGYKHKEISQMLSITESTSKTQYKRAKQILLHKLKSKVYDDQS